MAPLKRAPNVDTHTAFGEMRRLPPLTALRAFEAAARLSSVTAAAAELGVSHSAVSQQIKVLEDYFGETLFARRGRRVAPTAPAMALLEEVRTAFDCIAVASERLRHKGGRRTLTVNAPPCFAAKWLIPRIADFQRRHPAFELRLTTSDASGVARLDRPYDFVIRQGVIARRGHVCRPLLDDAATPVLHPSLLEHRTQHDPAQLKGLVLLRTSSQPDAWPRWFGEHSPGALDPSEGPVFDNAALAHQAALGGLGAALVPTAFVVDDLAEGRLIAPFAQLVVKGPGYHLLFRESAAEERGPRELLKWLEAEAGMRGPRAPARPRPAARTTSPAPERHA